MASKREGGALGARALPRVGRWVLIAALVLLAAVLVPIAASGHISTEQLITDRSWFWQNPLPQGNDLRGQRWTDVTRGRGAGVAGTPLTTDDGGHAWAAHEPRGNRDLTGISFANSTTGWAVGVSGTTATRQVGCRARG